MKNKIATYNELNHSNAQQIITSLRNERYSLLDSIGCHKMRREMRSVGLACRAILQHAERKAGGMKHSLDPDYPQRLRKAMLKTLTRGAPMNFHGNLSQVDGGIILGFNHPTLGEIIRIIALCLDKYPDRDYLFPVNIAWYEALAPIADRMERFGLHIVPTITPPTRAKIADIVDDYTMELVDKISREFNTNYISSCSWMSRKGAVIAVAPSATRQPTVFKTNAMFVGEEEINPPTMTYLAMSLGHNKTTDYAFQAIAVAPPRKAKRGLNLFKNYDLFSAATFPKREVIELCRSKSPLTHERCFERAFLMSIVECLNANNRGDLGIP